MILHHLAMHEERANLSISWRTPTDMLTLNKKESVPRPTFAKKQDSYNTAYRKKENTGSQFK
jgi:hypothetical protein